MSLKNIYTTLYVDASECNFDSFVRQALMNFENRILNIYNFAHEEVGYDLTKDHAGARQFIKDSMYKPDFFKVFWEAARLLKTLPNPFPATLGYPRFDFNVNPKNINFETTLFDIEDRIAYGGKAQIDPDSTFETNDITDIRDIPNWKDLFGKDSFPYFHIYTFRLGNTEYFAYSLNM